MEIESGRTDCDKIETAENIKFFRLGGVFRNPMVNLSCHMASEIMLDALLVIRLTMLSFEECDCLGKPPLNIEYVILVWFIARIFTEVCLFVIIYLSMYLHGISFQAIKINPPS